MLKDDLLGNNEEGEDADPNDDVVVVAPVDNNMKDKEDTEVEPVLHNLDL